MKPAEVGQRLGVYELRNRTSRVVPGGGLRAQRRGPARGARLAGGDAQGRARLGKLRPLLALADDGTCAP